VTSPIALDRRHVARQILIDLYSAVRGVELDPRGLEAETLGVGQAAGRDKRLFDLEDEAVGERDAQ
jgi:hypothetical protein